MAGKNEASKRTAGNPRASNPWAVNLRGLAPIFSADAIVRTAYQMGKAPVLPIFAAMLGATDLLLGLVVSVSTLTGILVKPVIGFVSDNQGRRRWLLIAAFLFIAMPFAYPFVHTPGQLFALRMVHGLATAIFGPVSLAFVAEMATQGRATRMGIFGIGRSIGYLLAPVSAAFLLTQMTPQTLFMLTGAIAALALLPIFALEARRENIPAQNAHQAVSTKYRGTMSGLFGWFRGWIAALANALLQVSQRPALWVAGGLEMMVNTASYAVRAFLPLHIIATSQGNYAIVLAGLFFSIQEASHLLIRPIGGMAADRFGRMLVIWGGMILMALGLFLLPYLTGDRVIIGAMILGAAQAFIFPACLAMIADQTGNGVGAGMGVYGALRNLGKVLGPVIAGLILLVGSFDHVLLAAGSLLLAAAFGGGLLMVSTRRSPAP